MATVTSTVQQQQQQPAALSSPRVGGGAKAVVGGLTTPLQAATDALMCVGMTLMAPVLLLVVMVLSLYNSCMSYIRTELRWNA